MIGESYGTQNQKGRRRRALLVPFLLLLAFLLGGLSVGMLRGEPKASTQPTPSTSSASDPSSIALASPTALGSVPAPSASGTEKVQGEQLQPTGLGNGGQVIPVGGLDFSIAGQAGGLAPGVSTPIRLTLTNPNSMPISVTILTVAVAPDSTPAGCSSATNIRLTQASVSEANPIVVPARGRVTLSTAPRAPQITLLNLPNVNQDVCKNKTFALTFSGSAHS